MINCPLWSRGRGHGCQRRNHVDLELASLPEWLANRESLVGMNAFYPGPTFRLAWTRSRKLVNYPMLRQHSDSLRIDSALLDSRTTLVTRSGFRKVVQGGLLVDWGIEGGEKWVCLRLEANPDAVGMYENVVSEMAK